MTIFASPLGGKRLRRDAPFERPACHVSAKPQGFYDPCGFSFANRVGTILQKKYAWILSGVN